jgi:hypothetical protein
MHVGINEARQYISSRSCRRLGNRRNPTILNDNFRRVSSAAQDINDITNDLEIASGHESASDGGQHFQTPVHRGFLCQQLEATKSTKTQPQAFSRLFVFLVATPIAFNARNAST